MFPSSAIDGLDPEPESDDLFVRQVERRDRDALIALFTEAHTAPDGTPATSVGWWVQDLFGRPHPTVSFSEMLVAEDLRTGALVSSLMMIPQTWCYDGVPLKVNCLELGATRPEYRRRGLMSRQLELLLEGSARRGELIQAQTDILYFQRGFGYLPVMTQRAGRGGHARELPPVPSGGEPVRVRPGSAADIPLLTELDDRMRRRVLLSCLRDEAQWTYELSGRSPGHMMRSEILIVESSTGPVGYLLLGYGGIPSHPIPHWLPGLECPEPVVSVAGFELLSGVSWWEVVPSVLRQLTAGGEIEGHDKPMDGYMLWLGTQHPAYDVLSDLLVRNPPHIGWFLRVPDKAALLQEIRPVLEQRLIGTAAESFTGELRIHLYHHGLSLRFEAGKLFGIGPWPAHSRRGSDASLPEQMFLQLIFGHATWDELAPAFPDCRLQTRTARLLLPLLFPRGTSSIWPLI
ncbi:GNAT family N-acetyltransferase [Streptomyces sp. NPDC020681]|uniref:GNAT family N-acetyltransferase n=1 Tax=Streptomyces sp. NPDC020681 TaxID=3365083 RepID=UPI00379B0FDC